MKNVQYSITNLIKLLKEKNSKIKILGAGNYMRLISLKKTN